MLHTSIISPACFRHIEPLSWELLTNKEGWVLAVIDFIYGLNLISLDVSMTTLLEISFVNGSTTIFSDFTKSRIIILPSRRLTDFHFDLNMSV